MNPQCFVPGCKTNPVARIKYRDSMNDLCTENRCKGCSHKLQNSSKTDVVEFVLLDEDGNEIEAEEQYRKLSEEEKTYIRELTGGPLAPFAV